MYWLLRLCNGGLASGRVGILLRLCTGGLASGRGGVL